MRTLVSVLTVLAALSGLPAFASEEAERWYQVEVIVFLQLEPAGLDAETWPPDPGEPALDGSIDPIPEVSLLDELLPGPESVQAGPVAFKLLGEGERRLDAQFDYMRRSRYYRPLLHLAWRQPGFGDAEARPVRLFYREPSGNGAQAVPPVPGASMAGEDVEAAYPFLEGTIRLRRARYLHVDADLVWRIAPEPDLLDMDLYRDGSGDDGPDAGAPPVRGYRLTESRRMRSGELHFLDHPVFGVLVRVDRYTPPEPAVGAGAAEAPASTPSR